jgi:N-acetylglucosaminyl-diphospho-decaprenol L-rhamnosyltransferase
MIEQLPPRTLNADAAVLIIVINYRTPALTLACIESLSKIAQTFCNAHLVIVDNGSGDDSLHQLRTAESLRIWSERASVVALEENIGYAAGNNAVIRLALNSDTATKFIWLLNSDTQARVHALDALIESMKLNSCIGIVGSRLENVDGTPQRSAFRFPSILGEWEATIRWGVMTRLCARWVVAPPAPLGAARTDWVPGASMLIRREVFERIGLLDEKFFMYFEDVDFCRRAQNANWETWYIPNSRVEHRVGASSNVTSDARVRQRMPRYWFDARGNYFLKHHTRFYFACANFVWLLGFGVWRVRQFIQRKPDVDPPCFWRDFFTYNILGKGIRA